MGLSFFIGKERFALLRAIKRLPLHGKVKVDQMPVKFRSVHAGEFHFISDHKPAGSAHAGSVHHNGVHGYDRSDAVLLCCKAAEFHHDHRADGDAVIITVSFRDQVFQAFCDHAAAAVGSVVRCHIDVGHFAHLIFQDNQVFCLGADDDIAGDAVLMQPFGLRINRRSDKIFERISRFAVEILRCTDTDRLEDNLDRPFLTVIICDCERNSLSCLIQLGDNEKSSGEKPVFAPLPKRKSVKTVTLEQALKQLDLPQLPRLLGKAKDGAEIIAAAGPFGPYLKGGKYNIPLGKEFDPYTITLEEAEPLYEKKRDSYIADWGEIQIIEGAYGPYVKGPGRRNFVRIPKDVDPKTVTKEQAEEYLANKPKKTRRPTKRRTATKKPTKKQ